MSRKLAILLLVLANVLWGSSYAIVKVALAEIPPPLLGALRVVLAVALLWPILIWRTRRAGLAEKRLIEPVAIGDLVRLVRLGLLGVAASYLLDYWGISLTTATDAALLIVGEVIFTALLAGWLVGERLGYRKSIGVLVGSAGVLILVLGNGSAGLAGGGWARAAGDALILAALLCEAIYTVLGAGLARKYQPLTVLTLVNTGSLLVWLPILLWYIVSGHFPALSWAAIAGVVYLAVVASGLCYLIWLSVNSVAGASLGAVSLFVQPLVGALIGLALLGDPLTVALGAGAALIFGALYLMTVPARAELILADEGASG